MWTRVELKDRAKVALKYNYWKTVLVSMILVFIGSSDSSVSSVTELIPSDQSGMTALENYELNLGGLDALNVLGIGMGIAIGILAILLPIAILIGIFLFSPIEVGIKRFLIKNLNAPAEMKELAYGFDHSYMNIVKTIFLRDLYIFLWSLLFVIPGIIKAYEYRMIPYLLAENPKLSTEQTFAISKQMMTGNKWNAFVLDLSFLGWDILSTCTLGLVGVFYVEPYRNLTSAALYEELSLIYGRPAFANYGYQEYQYQQPQQEAENPYTSSEEEI